MLKEMGKKVYKAIFNASLSKHVKAILKFPEN